MTATALSLLCFSCTKTQVAHSENEKTITPPIMGWSSWNAFRVDISEDIIKHQADLMVEKGLKDAGYHYINVDDASSANVTTTESCSPTRNVSRTE